MSENMIDYHNKEIQRLLDKYVTIEKYGKYKPILDEIIQRRAFEFGFGEGKIEKEIQNMVKHLNKIEYYFDNNENSTTLAYYNKSNKTININIALIGLLEGVDLNDNSDISKKYVGKLLFGLLTHEVYHAIDNNENRLTGIEYLNEYNRIEGTYVNEIITESAAYRTTNNKDIKEISKGYSETLAYSKISFMSNLISNMLGISEKDLLAKGLGKFEEFYNLFSDKHGDNVLWRVESSAFYANKFTKLGCQKEKSNAEKYKHMYGNILDIYKNQIFEDKRELSMEVVGEIYYRSQKINDIINSSIDLIEKYGYINNEEKNNIKKELSKEKETIRNIPLDLFVALEADLEPESAEFQYAKQGKLQEDLGYYQINEILPELVEYKGVSYEEMEQRLLKKAQCQPEFFSYITKVREDDFTSKTIWDEKIYSYTGDILYNENIINQSNSSKDNYLIEDDDIR